MTRFMAAWIAAVLSYGAVLMGLGSLADNGETSAFPYRLTAAICVGLLVFLLVWRSERPRE